MNTMSSSSKSELRIHGADLCLKKVARSMAPTAGCSARVSNEFLNLSFQSEPMPRKNRDDWRQLILLGIIRLLVLCHACSAFAQLLLKSLACRGGDIEGYSRYVSHFCVA